MFSPKDGGVISCAIKASTGPPMIPRAPVLLVLRGGGFGATFAFPLPVHSCSCLVPGSLRAAKYCQCSPVLSSGSTTPLLAQNRWILRRWSDRPISETVNPWRAFLLPSVFFFSLSVYLSSPQKVVVITYSNKKSELPPFQLCQCHSRTPMKVKLG